MAILSKGKTFSNGAVTPTDLNNLVDNATFVPGASGTTDDSTLEVNSSGRLQVKEGGIGSPQIANGAVGADQIADGSVTADKLDVTGLSFGSNEMSIENADVDVRFKATTTQTSTSRYPGFESTVYGSGYPVMQLLKARGTQSSPTAAQSGDTIGRVSFFAYGIAGFQQETGEQAFIAAIATQNQALNAEGTTIVFHTTSNNSNAPTERMRFGTSGELLIGGTTSDSTAAVRIDSTTKGFLPPRLTTTQRDNISSPTAGLMIYNSTTNKLNFYNGTSWEAVTSA